MYTLCQKENIVYQAFALLSGNRQALVQPCVTEIAHHHNKTVPQVIYRFALELGMLPLTGTTDVSHMREALDIFDFTLTRNEIETLLATSLTKPPPKVNFGASHPQDICNRRLLHRSKRVSNTSG